jgi:hypothetical protein
MGSSTALGSNVPNIPLDPNQGMAQAATLSGISNLSSNIADYQGLYNAQASSPYAAQAMQGAQAGGQALQAQGVQNIGNSNVFAGVPQQLSPAVAATLNTAYDPQDALRAQMYQQSMDQTNAQLAQSGLSFTPWAAGVTNNNANTFGTNWLQSQLGREQTGAATIAQLLSAGEGAATTGAQLGAQGAGQIASGALLPYQTQTGINQNTAQALGNLTAAQQQQVQDYQAYVNAANAQAANAISAGNDNNQYMASIGSGIGTAAGLGLGAYALYNLPLAL